MTVNCPACSYENPDTSEFCGACGSEIIQPYATNEAIEIHPAITQPKTPEPEGSNSEPVLVDVTIPTCAADTARLISKQNTSPITDFSLDSSNATVGRFDPDTGPVDVDLEGFPSDDMISRNHAEIYRERGEWKVKDLGSTNGVFIKRSGQTRFSARITMPETLNSGDEIAFAKIRFLFQSP